MPKPTPAVNIHLPRMPIPGAVPLAPPPPIRRRRGGLRRPISIIPRVLTNDAYGMRAMPLILSEERAHYPCNWHFLARGAH